MILPLLESLFMDSVAEVMAELRKRGSEQTRKTFARHGAPSNMFGVKIADLKVIAKQIKGNQALAYELYETGNHDAMYLAGIVADGAQMTKNRLREWARDATWGMQSQYTVPFVACESQYAHEFAIKWIESKKEPIATSGWCTYSGIVAIFPDDELDLEEIKGLLRHIVEQIDAAPDQVRYTMNGFVISVGCYVKPLLKLAKQAAKKIGVVSVDMGDTACKVPLATAYIEKVEKMGRVGKKRKTIKC